MMDNDNMWYLEYHIHKNRPGLMGDIASILGMLSINIFTINGVEDRRRGMLLKTDNREKIRRPPTDFGASRQHHHYRPSSSDIVGSDGDPPRTVFGPLPGGQANLPFYTGRAGSFVDFMAELMKREGHQMIGVRGMPRVGKTESIVASSVCANKRWTFVSSTLLRQTVRSQLAEDEMNPDNVFIIDGIVSTLRATERHHTLVREILQMDATKVIEHPDIFMRETEYTLDDFNVIIELRNHPEEKIAYDVLDSDFAAF